MSSCHRSWFIEDPTNQDVVTEVSKFWKETIWTAFVRCSDVFGLQMQPSKDADPELRHSKCGNWPSSVQRGRESLTLAEISNFNLESYKSCAPPLLTRTCHCSWCLASCLFKRKQSGFWESPLRGGGALGSVSWSPWHWPETQSVSLEY